jgi:uncharacterized protein (TIGR03067 family)
MRTALLALSAVLVFAAAAPGEAAKKELDRFQGTWVATALTQNGKEVPAAVLAKARLTWTVKGDQMTFKTPKGVQKGTIRLDPTKAPKRIDFKGTDESGRPLVVLGIYRFKGKALEICADKDRRPKEFKSEPKGALLTTLERQAD